MPVTYNFKKGIDIPPWQWLAPYAGGTLNSYHGGSRVYDGRRFIYWVIQGSVTSTAAGTTQLWRYDTWSNGWQYIANSTSGNQGMDIEYDSVRNVLYIIPGSGLTSWQVFNLNTSSVTIANVTCAAWALTTMSPVLPLANNIGGSLIMPSDDVVSSPIDTGAAAATGQTTTTVVSDVATGTFGQGMVGLQLRVTSGAQSGQIRTIASVVAPTNITLSSALPGVLSTGDTFAIELVSNTATAGTTTTLTAPANVAWTTNIYTNQDVIITAGTGSGQRRRIASNTTNVLTLASAVTGNTTTGPFTTAPDATSVFKIVPSKDFLYYQPGNSTALYKIDVAQTTGAAWSGALATAPAAFAGGGNTFYPAAYAPYQILGFRGGATATVYSYNIGLNTWSTLTTYPASETFTTGASATMLTGKRKLLVQKEGSTRIYVIDLLTGFIEPAGTMPYASPSTYDGKRAAVITTPDGAQFLYILRSGGSEFFRVPLEWV